MSLARRSFECVFWDAGYISGHPQGWNKEVQLRPNTGVCEHSRNTLHAHLLAPLMHHPRLEELRGLLEAHAAQPQRIRELHLYRSQVGLRFGPNGDVVVV